MSFSVYLTKLPQMLRLRSDACERGFGWLWKEAAEPCYLEFASRPRSHVERQERRPSGRESNPRRRAENIQNVGERETLCCVNTAATPLG
jgi:hypothetical protein